MTATTTEREGAHDIVVGGVDVAVDVVRGVDGVDEGSGDGGGVGKLHGLLPFEHTTSQGLDVFDDDAPGFDMSEVKVAGPTKRR